MTKKYNYNTEFLPVSHPHLVPFYSAKNERAMDTLKAGSNYKAWWTLPCGHEFQRMVQYFVKSQGCSVCINKKIMVGVNDFKSIHPELFKKHWSAANNLDPTTVTSGSDKPVLWLCSEGHETERKLRKAVKKPDTCFACSPKLAKQAAKIRGQKHLKSTKNENRLSEHFPQLKKFYSESNRYQFEALPHPSYTLAQWDLPCGHSIRREVDYFTRSQACHYCGNKKLLKGFNDLATTAPHLAPHVDSDYYGIPPEEILAGPTSLIRVLCSKCGRKKVQRVEQEYDPVCFECFGTGTSRGEQELKDFLRDLGLEVVANDRKVLRGREIDALLPQLSLGVEFNGVYWHSDEVIRSQLGVSAEAYHRSKLEEAGAAGVTLLFVWEDDWKKQPEAVKEALLKVIAGERAPRLLTALRKRSRGVPPPELASA